MTLSYDEFKAYVTETLWRTSDTVFASNLDQLILDAEARMSRDLRIEDNTQIVNATITKTTYDLPLDYAEIKSVSFLPKGAASYITPQDFAARNTKNEGNTETPPYYTIHFKQLHFLGSIGIESPLDIQVIYYTKILSFKDNPNNNKFYTDYPDMYLAAVLRQSYIFLRDHTTAGIYEQQYAALAQSVVDNEHDRKYTSGPLNMKLPGNVR